ncbi:MAG: SpoVT/AbrB domain-containing protein [Cyanobacteriota bacterium]|nr:SpoVT/AbrB domain-containing protein [Cyanobacteriota bacterium]
MTKTTVSYNLLLENKGRLTLPSEVQQKLDIKPGDPLILCLAEDGNFKLLSARKQVRKIRGILKDISPQRSLVDELIQERREEAA